MSIENHIEMQKITVEVPVDTLERAKSYVNGGTTDAVREGLENLSRKQAYEALRDMRGIWKGKTLNPTLEEMRSWEDDDPDNPWNDGH